jgi:hypothetical protein
MIIKSGRHSNDRGNDGSDITRLVENKSVTSRDHRLRETLNIVKPELTYLPRKLNFSDIILSLPQGSSLPGSRC